MLSVGLNDSPLKISHSLKITDSSKSSFLNIYYLSVLLLFFKILIEKKYIPANIMYNRHVTIYITFRLVAVPKGTAYRQIIDISNNATHTRKSLVKGERFIRSVWMAEMMPWTRNCGLFISL